MERVSTRFIHHTFQPPTNYTFLQGWSCVRRTVPYSPIGYDILKPLGPQLNNQAVCRKATAESGPIGHTNLKYITLDSERPAPHGTTLELWKRNSQNRENLPLRLLAWNTQVFYLGPVLHGA